MKREEKWMWNRG